MVDVKKIVSNFNTKGIFWDYGWSIGGLLIIYTVSSLLAWGRLFGEGVSALPMTVLVISLYTGIWINIYQSDFSITYRLTRVSIFYITVGFLVIFSILALFRAYYSRSFLLLSYGLMIIWVLSGLLIFKERQQKFIIIKGGIADKLRNMEKIGCKYLSQYKKIQESFDYDGIVIDMHVHDDPKLLQTLADLGLSGMPVLHAATVLEQHFGRTHLDYVAHEGIYDLAKNNPYRIFKRIWEICLIVLLLPIVFPVMVTTIFAIKLDSEGPVIFSQKRVGKGGGLFNLYKFRSMYIESERNGSKFAIKKDDRITNVGRFIRKTRIDELPQFWNVFKGDMSLIGPRPEQKEFVKYFKDEIPFYSYRHKIRPGITGWAQVKDGYAASLKETKKKLEYDLYYLKNMSLTLDLLILYGTVKTILTGSGSR